MVSQSVAKMKNIKKSVIRSRRNSDFFFLQRKQRNVICEACECDPCDCSWGHSIDCKIVISTGADYENNEKEIKKINSRIDNQV